jgi:Protein of unknown function (DUF3768)
MNDTIKTTAIRALNDAFRQSLHGGTVLFTAGVVALGGAAETRILAALQTFDAFDDANDPWGEHDFGSFELDGARIFFKIEYYDLARARHSDDPADPSKTERVLTLMLASEY